MNDANDRLATLFRETRVRKRISQEQVADAVGISRNGYGKMELRERGVPLDLIAPICAVLDIDGETAMSAVTGYRTRERRQPAGGCEARKGETHMDTNIRTATVRAMADTITSRLDLIAHILGIEIPPDVDTDAARTAYVFAETLQSMQDGMKIRNPSVTFTKQAKDGYFDDLSDEEYNTELGVVETESEFFAGEWSAPVDVLRRMLYLARPSELDALAGHLLEKRFKIYSVREGMAARKEIDAAYDAGIEAAKRARDGYMSPFREKLREATADEREAEDAAEANWKSLYRGPLGAHPTQRDITMQERADGAFDMYQELKKARKEAEHRKCPEFFDAEVRANRIFQAEKARLSEERAAALADLSDRLRKKFMGETGRTDGD